MVTDKTLGLSWLTERVTLLAQLHDKTMGMIEKLTDNQMGMIEKLTDNQKVIGDTLRIQQESIAELDKKCNYLLSSVKSLCSAIEQLKGRK